MVEQLQDQDEAIGARQGEFSIERKMKTDLFFFAFLLAQTVSPNLRVVSTAAQ